MLSEEPPIASHIIKCKALNKGARVAIVAPASRPARPSILARAVRLIKDMEFEPLVGEHVMASHGYMAGSDPERLADLSAALIDPAIDAVWAISGGFGSIRLLDRLPYEAFKAKPKPVLGGDDVSHILLALYAKTSVVTFAAPNLDRLDTKAGIDRLRRILYGKSIRENIESTDPIFADFAFSPVPGIKKGRVLGCNLTALVSLFGTAYKPDLEGAILLLEDRAERNDILDRWLTTLYVSGQLERVAAVGFGQFENCDTRAAFNMLSFEELASDRLTAMQKACCFGLPFGQSATGAVVPIGLTGTLDCAQGKLTFAEDFFA